MVLWRDCCGRDSHVHNLIEREVSYLLLSLFGDLGLQDSQLLHQLLNIFGVIDVALLQLGILAPDIFDLSIERLDAGIVLLPVVAGVGEEGLDYWAVFEDEGGSLGSGPLLRAGRLRESESLSGF